MIWGILIFASIPSILTLLILIPLIFGSEETKKSIREDIKNYHPPGHE